MFAAVVVGVTIADKSPDEQAAPATIPATPITSVVARDTPPPWPAPSDVSAAVAQAGLPMLGMEGSALHFHSHLDVFVDGQPVAVPANIGVDERTGAMSPLHIHDGSGVIHVESPTQATFSLAQLFAEWQVSLSESQLGGLRTGNGKELQAYVNGQHVPGNPGALTLGEHDQIALVYGTAPATSRAAMNGGTCDPATGGNCRRTPVGSGRIGCRAGVGWVRHGCGCGGPGWHVRVRVTER